MKKKFIRTIATALSLTVLLSAIPASAEGEQTVQINGKTVILQNATTNLNTDPDAGFVPYSINYKYDDQNRVIEELKITANLEETTTYTYNSDGSRSEKKTSKTVQVQNNNVTSSGMAGDQYIYTAKFTDIINASGQVWTKAQNDYAAGRISLSQRDMIQKQASMEADLARADFIVMFPYSYFAYYKFGGSQSNGHPLNRLLYNNEDGGQQYGLDVMVIQRVLELYEFFEVSQQSEYGFYGPETSDAVSRYQKWAQLADKSGRVYKDTYQSLFGRPTTVAGGLSISSLSGSGSKISPPHEKRKYDYVKMLRMFRIKHNTVRDMAAVREISAESDRKTEAYIPGGGVKGGRGYADIVKISTKEVWEVKHDTKPQWSLGPKQLTNYVEVSKGITPNSQFPYVPLKKGHKITPFEIPYSKDEALKVRPGSDIGQEGMIYYRTVKKDKNGQTVLASQKQETLANQTVPDKNVLVSSLKQTGQVLAVLVLAAGVVAVILAVGVPSGAVAAAASLILIAY